MTQDYAIRLSNVSKIYKLYDKPIDRVKESLTIGSKKKYYKEFSAVKNVSFEVKKGETVGIVGKNGSGKSTLLKMITGVLTPTSGDIEINGRISALLELGAGFNQEFTGIQNIFFNASMLGMSRNEIEKKLPEIVAFADIGEHIYQPVKTYSSGMFVRLAFAVAIHVEPDILIIDEALAVGDDLFQKKCFAKIDAFRKSGKTVLFVSHSGSLVIELCDRAILMDEGEKLMMGQSQTVVNLYQKLIFAPMEKKDSIKEQIRKIDLNPLETIQKPTQAKIDILSDESNSEPASISETALEEEEYFDPELVPKNPILYESKSAKIYDYHIYNYKGEDVNVLRFGKKYILSYKVEFFEKCQNVRFGMTIKTKTGIDISGAATARPGEGISLIEAGTKLQVEFEFTPKLTAGVYFLRCGVVGVDTESEVFLDRQIDMVAFRMLEQKNSRMNALVDFDISSNVYSI